MDTEFLWRAEMACRAAWPAAAETDIGGWSARRSGGTIRRVNSLNQMPGARPLDAPLAERVEDHYRLSGQPSLIRLMSFVGHDPRAMLERRGYQREGNTTTLSAEIDPAGRPVPGNVRVSETPDPAWLAARGRIAVSDQQQFTAMLAMIRWPTFYASAEVDGEIRSLAYGTVVDGLLVLESVATDEALRGRGLARSMLTALFNRAAAQGTRRAVLQVVTDNTPARKLYRALGFGAELFDYFYMRQTRA